MSDQNEHKNLSYNLCGVCDYWDGEKCIITNEKTTAETPCSDDENFCRKRLFC